MATAAPSAQKQYSVNLTYTERQLEVLNRIYGTPAGWKFLGGFGGALGGGKSDLLSSIPFTLGVMVWPGSRILLGRDELGPLEKTTLRYFFDKVNLPKALMEHNQQDRIVKVRLDDWPDGLWTELHYHPLSDAEKVQGEEYNIILVDEANGIDESTMGYLNGRLRFKLKHPELARTKERFVLLCASNPHPGWYTDWFWKGEVLKTVDGTVVPGDVKTFTDNDRHWRFPDAQTDVHFIRSRMTDNPYLPQGYAQQVTIGMDPGLAKRFIEGRFDVFDGQVFTEFKAHSVMQKPSGNIWDYPVPGSPPTIPAYESVVGGIDLGGEGSAAHWTGGLIGVRTATGRTIIVDEFKGRGAGVDMKLAEWIAKMDVKWARPIRSSISWTGSKDQKWGLNFLARGAQIHIKPNRATFDARDKNVAEIQRMFMEDLLFITPNCRGLIEELRNYVWDPKNPTKYLRKNDDLVDTLQYLIEGKDRVIGAPPVASQLYAPMR